ncbi:MAG: lipocalin-like domain-containing protein [Pseudomonadota bacterium]
MNKWVSFIVVVLMLSGIWIYFANPSTQSTAQTSLIQFLSSDYDPDRFAAADPDYALSFPKDHGAHDRFRQEWWYFTGNLEDSNGRPFGFQLTFFRSYQPPGQEIADSSWSSDQTWLAHFAISDPDSARFYAFEDWSRQSINLTGSTRSPFSVWLHDWSVRQIESACARCFTLHLKAESDTVSIDLTMNSADPPVLQGKNGFSVKSHDPSIASHYYSYPNLETSGSLTIGGQSIRVDGVSWMDREWSSAVLSKTQSGWDWFAIHLENNYKFMVFRVRDEAHPFHHAILLSPDNSTTVWRSDEINLQERRHWTSDTSGRTYPVGWTIILQKEDMETTVQIQTALDDQELKLGFVYYEGMVFASLKSSELELNGRGYMELTGY